MTWLLICRHDDATDLPNGIDVQQSLCSHHLKLEMMKLVIKTRTIVTREDNNMEEKYLCFRSKLT